MSVNRPYYVLPTYLPSLKFLSLFCSRKIVEVLLRQMNQKKNTISIRGLLFYNHNALILFQNSSAPRKIINSNKPVERQNGKSQLPVGNTQNGLQKKGMGSMNNMKNKPVPPAEPKKMKTRAQLNKVFSIFNFNCCSFKLNYVEINCAPNSNFMFIFLHLEQTSVS